MSTHSIATRGKRRGHTGAIEIRERGDYRRGRPRASRRVGTKECARERRSDVRVPASSAARCALSRAASPEVPSFFEKADWPTDRNLSENVLLQKFFSTLSSSELTSRCADRRCGWRRFSRRRRSPRELSWPRSLRPPGPRTKLAWGHGRRATRATSAFWTMRRNHLPPHPQARTVRCTARGAWGATWCFLVWTAP